MKHSLHFANNLITLCLLLSLLFAFVLVLLQPGIALTDYSLDLAASSVKHASGTLSIERAKGIPRRTFGFSSLSTFCACLGAIVNDFETYRKTRITKDQAVR